MVYYSILWDIMVMYLSRLHCVRENVQSFYSGKKNEVHLHVC